MGSTGSKEVNKPLTDEEMQAELDKHFADVKAVIDEFMSQKPTKRGTRKYPDYNSNLDEIAEERGIEGLEYQVVERHDLRELIDDYIKEWNSNVKNYGTGFQFWDTDAVVNILYKDGSCVRIDSDTDEKTKINTSNVDSIIVDSGWGTAIAGKHVKLENYRETVDYGKYGYKDLKQRYNDDDDIRADFSVEYHSKKR